MGYRFNYETTHFYSKVDKKDPVLGFFHNWISALSEKFEKTSVICLEKGEHQLSPDIKIFLLVRKKENLA